MREARAADSSGTAMATAIGGEPSGDADTSKQVRGRSRIFRFQNQHIVHTSVAALVIPKAIL